MAKSIGTLLREAREATKDPLTDAPFSQQRLGDLLGVSDATISKWENDKNEKPPSARHLNRLAEILNLSVDDVLSAGGYRLQPSALTPDSLELLRLFRRLPQFQQQLLLAQVRASLEYLRQQER